MLPKAPAVSTTLSTAGSLTRSILVSVAGLVAIGFVCIVSLLLLAAAGQDHVAAEASLRAIATALHAQRRQMLGTATDVAYWDEAVDNVHFTVNHEWTDAYFDEEYIDSMELDDIYVFGPGNRVTFSFCRDRDEAQAAALVDPDMLRLVDAARRVGNEDNPPSAIGLLKVGGTVVIAATSRIRYVEDSRSPPPEDSSILFLTRRLDAAGLERMQRDHSLEPMRVVAEDTRERGTRHLPLPAFANGSPLGFLAWRPERPGQALLRAAVLPLSGVGAIMLALLITIGRAARRAGKALDAGNDALQLARATLEQKVIERTAALQATQSRLQAIFENAAEGIFQVDQEGCYLGANPSMAAIFGYASVSEFLAEATDHTRHDAERREEFLRAMDSFGAVGDFISTARRRDGTTIWISQNARIVQGDDGRCYFEGMLSDITHRKRIEQQLVHEAMHDALTGLPNRKLFAERLGQALIRAASGGGRRPAVLLLDCDRFKLINDSLGHAAGDELLIGLAHRLSLCMRRADTLARLGGDEFAVLTEGDDDSPLRLAQRLQEACRRPFVLRGRDVHISLSIGTAILGDVPIEPNELLRNADIAMYEAKSRGRSTTVLFEWAMHSRVLDRLQIEYELRAAVAGDQLFVLYQPIVALADGSIAGFEALVRWRHPERGLIPPDAFIPVAEESGMIGTLGEEVLRKATAEMARWLRREDAPDRLFLAVNLSPLQLDDGKLPQRMAGILAESGLAPDRLKLEITETAIMANPIDVRETLAALDALGIRLCMDDFGTGYSSLSQLHSFPFDTLKIDRSFIARLSSGDEAVAIVRSILMLAENLGLSVVAEGIEDPLQREWLRAHGCAFGQGWLFARPLESAAVDALLSAQAENRASA
jgi:diguanylate cyclase (GGDEF)-like protein/PAS domain S-box-containing protein